MRWRREERFKDFIKIDDDETSEKNHETEKFGADGIHQIYADCRFVYRLDRRHRRAARAFAG